MVPTSSPGISAPVDRLVDGVGAAALATRDHSGRIIVRNALDHGAEWQVPNGIAVHSR
ncbi:hypothetical protein GCM10010289_63510 [Streptomyces violascens]|uniref:Uncharacterized protein n=1 Tax=Streptomyces violascens TaxID=67381 RepID=A0ABQ3QSR1_9ACTN|nr:hypothetical protein GCM10010289_63510 [Streptomyces violascens]GHI40292.1 hypothetical protein Sviol_47000 [Streptomyces violascens]